MYDSTECLKQTSTLQTFAFIMNWMKYHVVSSFVTYGSFLCQHEASTIKSTIVRNPFSAVAYTAWNITHTIEKYIAQKTFFRWFYMQEHHWLCTTEIIPPFAQNGTSYSAVVFYKVKRRHCYCIPCSVCKREKFDQFNISLNYVYKYSVLIR